MKKLNLGCGPNWKSAYPDYEGLDILPYGQHIQMDVLKFLTNEFILPIDGKYDEVIANHFLEHFDQDQLKTIFAGVHSLLKPSGIFKFVVPSLERNRAWVLSHKTFWNETTVNWLSEPEASETYGFGRWGVTEVVTNSRKDIHAVLVKL